METSRRSQPGIQPVLRKPCCRLIDEDQQKAVQQAENVLKGFSTCFEATYSDGLRQKLGLSTVEDGDADDSG